MFDLVPPQPVLVEDREAVDHDGDGEGEDEHPGQRAEPTDQFAQQGLRADQKYRMQNIVLVPYAFSDNVGLGKHC